MILQAQELPLVKAALALLDVHSDTNVILTVQRVGDSSGRGPRVTLDLSAAGVLIKAEFPDAAPAVEFYRWPAGLAQAYGIPLARISYRNEGD